MRTRSRIFSSAALGLLAATALHAQFRGFQAATLEPGPAVEAKAGETFIVPLTIRIRPGYHLNSDAPLEDYLIPARLTWDAAPFEVVGVDFPEPEIVKYEFSESPLSVFSGRIVIETRVRAPAKLPGPTEITGKLRYQACTEKACLAPTTLDVKARIR